MSIVKMKYINIIGNVEDFDRVAEKYIANYEINLEHAINELKNVSGLHQFNDVSPYSSLIKRIQTCVAAIGVTLPNVPASQLSGYDASQIINSADNLVKECIAQRDAALMEADKASELRSQIAPLQGMEFVLDKIWNFKFIKFRFGKLPRNSYDKLDRYIGDTNEVMFIPCAVGTDFVWSLYFTPEPFEERIDSIFTSLHFERFRISDLLQGTPNQAYEKLTAIIDKHNQTAEQAMLRARKYMEENIMKIAEAVSRLRHLSSCFNVRKYAARTAKRYYIVGWATEKTLKKLSAELDKDPDVTYVIEEQDTVYGSSPPTKLKNWVLFRPFEMFVENYGLPAYDEFDPTMFLAVTYSVLFGMMFGDVGQGCVLFFGGLLVARLTKMRLAAIISTVGMSSIIFGAIYGSVFGSEQIIHSPLFRPFGEENMMTTLMIAIIVGVFLIVLSMLLNIYNNLRRGDWASALCDPSGLSGLLFYSMLLGGVALPIFGVRIMPPTLVLALAIVSMGLIAIHQPLHRWAHKQTPVFPGGLREYLMLIFFELFEIVLSYITNTVSFVRVGAFALSHAGMMAVVFILMEGASAVGSSVIWFFGNVLVICLEGLIVGIQVLRLDFYEMFSRFYSGSGRKFVSLQDSVNINE